MKHICLILLFTLSCFVNVSQTKTDPYFVESTDTISTHGPNCITRNLLQDRQGNIWLASWQGIIKYDRKVFTNMTLKENLIHYHVFYVFEDKAGGLWFCTVRGGVYHYDGKTFRLFTTQDGLADNTVSCMTEDKNGNLWLGTVGGACIYNPLTAGPDGKHFRTLTMQDGTAQKGINAIMQDKTGMIWMGNKEGITRYDGKTFTAFTDQQGQPFKDTRAIMEDKAGNIWVGSVNGLVCYGDSLNNITAHGKYFTTVIKNLPINYMCQDQNANIWISLIESNPRVGSFGALYCYNGTTLTKVTEKIQPGDQQIFGVIAAKDGAIWFGTMKGPGRFDVSFTNHPCVNKSCTHNLPLQQAIKQHNDAIAKAFTYFAG